MDFLFNSVKYQKAMEGGVRSKVISSSQEIGQL